MSEQNLHKVLITCYQTFLSFTGCISKGFYHVFVFLLKDYVDDQIYMNRKHTSGLFFISIWYCYISTWTFSTFSSSRNWGILSVCGSWTNLREPKFTFFFLRSQQFVNSKGVKRVVTRGWWLIGRVVKDMCGESVVGGREVKGRMLNGIL